MRAQAWQTAYDYQVIYDIQKQLLNIYYSEITSNEM